MREGRLIVPDCPVIPYIEGDGIGKDIWSVSQKVIDGSEKAYAGQRSIQWREVLQEKRLMN